MFRGSRPVARRWYAPLAVMLVVFSLGTAALAQAPLAEALDKKIIEEAKARSELMANLSYLSDVIGPRLTGSAALKRANEWTAEKMKSYGLTSVHLEPWNMPEGWERGSVLARIMEPDNGRVLSLASLAWMPGTNGKVLGDVVALNAKDNKELAAFRGKLKGAILLDGPPRTLPSLDEMKKDGPMGQPFLKKKGDGSYEERMAFMKERANIAKAEGVAVILRDAGKHFGLLQMSGGWRGTDRPSAENRIPALYVAHNHYELLWRLATRQPAAPTRMEIEVNNKFVPGPIAVYNTVGEIRGSEKPDEYVVLGAHLDSWDLGSGTTDNGTGSAVVLEAARIIAKSGLQPKRTIRFVLFTGEEQGLHGSRAYCAQHKDELDKMSCCIVHDTGPGKVLGLGIGGRPAAQKILENELGILKDLGVTDFISRAGGGSDHQSFDAKGVPGFMFKQQTRDYFLYTHHSQADTFDRASVSDLIQGAQVMAIMATRIANLPDLLPREKK